MALNQISNPDRAPVPVTSPGLGHIIENFVAPDPCYNPKIQRHHVEEALRVLPIFEAQRRSASFDQVKNWLGPINASVRNPQPQDEFLNLRVPAIATVCADLPASVFNPETQREAMKAFKFWPAAGDVFDLLQPHAEKESRRIYAVKRIADTRITERQPDPERGPPSPEASEYVREVVRKYTAEVREREQEARMKGPSAGAAHLTPIQLLAVYSRDRTSMLGINTIREHRLRAELGVPTHMTTETWLKSLGMHP